jgi:hypothetical protein
VGAVVIRFVGNLLVAEMRNGKSKTLFANRSTSNFIVSFIFSFICGRLKKLLAVRVFSFGLALVEIILVKTSQAKLDDV